MNTLFVFLTPWYTFYKTWIESFQLGEGTTSVIYNISIAVIIIGTSCLAYILAKKLSYLLANSFSQKKNIPILHALQKNHFFSYLSYFFPLLIFRYNIHIFFPKTTKVINIIQDAYHLAFVVLFVLVIHSIISTFVKVNQYKTENRSKPIKGLAQFLQIIVWFFGFIICVSIITNQSTGAILAGFGAASAILMLIFKDSIIGLVAGVQISFNKMIKIGDWISLPKYEVDGEVLDITLTSIKVRNWDNSISSVPSYNLVVSDAVKNWQNMVQSGGRQIKRSINIDMLSVCFCTEEMIQRYKKIDGVQAHLDILQEKQKEHPMPFGKNLTNLGVFRRYLLAYLESHPRIHKGMIAMVRENQPTQFGVPLEVYCFTSTTVWKEYEEIQSEIMEHALSMASLFDLKIHEVTMALKNA